jgi:hypothetical protein
MNTDIPPEIEDRYEGEWIAWDTEACVVIAHDEDLDKVVDQVRAARTPGQLIYYHHILPRDAVIVGGL